MSEGNGKHDSLVTEVESILDIDDDGIVVTIDLRLRLPHDAWEQFVAIDGESSTTVEDAVKALLLLASDESRRIAATSDD